MGSRVTKRQDESVFLPDLPDKLEQEWDEVCKKPVTMMKKARARFLLLQCYRPYRQELEDLNKKIKNADFSVIVKLQIGFALRWQVDLEKGIDFFGTEVKPASVLQIDDATGQDALTLFRYKSSYSSNIIIGDFTKLENELLLQSAGYSCLFVNLSKADEDILDGIQTIRKNLGIPSPRNSSKKSSIDAQKTGLVRKPNSGLDAIKDPKAQDLYLIYLFSHGASSNQIKLKYNPKYCSTDTSTPGLISRRIPNLLRFIDPMNFGKLKLAKSGFRKITKSDFKKIKDKF